MIHGHEHGNGLGTYVGGTLAMNELVAVDMLAREELRSCVLSCIVYKLAGKGDCLLTSVVIGKNCNTCKI